jgi:membrane protein YdbS with pleckstrin-like domain
MIKIYLSTYFLLLIPISAASEVYLIKNQAINYKYSLIVLLVMVTSLNLFIAIWTKAENWFFDNFNSSPKEKTYRDGY